MIELLLLSLLIQNMKGDSIIMNDGIIVMVKNESRKQKIVLSPYTAEVTFLEFDGNTHNSKYIPSKSIFYDCVAKIADMEKIDASNRFFKINGEVIKILNNESYTPGQLSNRIFELIDEYYDKVGEEIYEYDTDYAPFDGDTIKRIRMSTSHIMDFSTIVKYNKLGFPTKIKHFYIGDKSDKISLIFNDSSTHTKSIDCIINNKFVGLYRIDITPVKKKYNLIRICSSFSLFDLHDKKLLNYNPGTINSIISEHIHRYIMDNHNPINIIDVINGNSFLIEYDEFDNMTKINVVGENYTETTTIINTPRFDLYEIKKEFD